MERRAAASVRQPVWDCNQCGGSQCGLGADVGKKQEAAKRRLPYTRRLLVPLLLPSNVARLPVIVVLCCAGV